jgi:excisionase family DNA binding protein
MSHTTESSPLERTALEPLLDVAAASVFLGVSRRQVHRLLKRNELPAVRVGKRTRFIPADLRAYLERHREGPGP